MLSLPRLAGFVESCSSRGSAAEKMLIAARGAHDTLHPLGIGHSYGPFAMMTTFRWELIFEMSCDGATWTQIEFPYKPGDIDVRPQWMPVGHFARLDWRLRFVPLGMGRGRWDLPDWVEGFVAQLLKGSAPVARLTTRAAEIVASPPRYVRASVWEYHLSSCDPTVHQCQQVAITCAQRDVGYAAASSRLGAPP